MAMEQKHINTDIFAQLTLHEMLLTQVVSAMLAGYPDKGELFIQQFSDQLRYKLTVPPGSEIDDGVDAQQLQEVALHRAENFFRKICKNLESQ
mgnify:FL=1